MRAIRLHEFGPAFNLQLEELPDLMPEGDQVRIAVKASGVHLLDTALRAGTAGGAPLSLPELPTIPGREVAGVVDQVGSGVSSRWIGARVVAHLGMVPGGYASQAVTGENNLFALGETTDFAEAVAMVGTGRTAQGILESVSPKPDDVVLVPSAAGGLGWLLVQAALQTGAEVVAAAGGPDKVARVKELGPHLVVDYRADGWADQVRQQVGQVTLVYDGVGGAVGRQAFDLLAPGGHLEVFGWSAGSATHPTDGELVQRRITTGFSLGQKMAARPGGIPGLAGRALERLAGAAWRPLVTTYPLADAARAHADLENRAAMGKVVLVP